MKALVAGASGFIGSKLVQQLLKLNFQVIGISRKKLLNSHKKLQAYSIDITDQKRVLNLPKVDIIFHTAAFIPPSNSEIYIKELLDINVIGTANLAKYALNVNAKQFIFSSTSSIYGLVTSSLLDENYPKNPSTYYGLSKKFAEEELPKQLKSPETNLVILRYSSVYGPKMHQESVLPMFISSIKNNQDIKIWGSGKRTQDFVYVEDVVNANILSALKKVEGTYNIGSGKEISLLTLAKTIKSIYPDSQSKIVFDNSKPDDPQRICLDYSKAKKSFGYRSRWNLERGLKQLKQSF